MPTVQHEFTDKITEILNIYFPEQGSKILDSSELLQYLNIKTKAANLGSKSRPALGTHYAIYVLVEDYLNNEFHIKGSYDDYKGAQYTALFNRQREFPFGSKLQNHSLNNRVNSEFKNKFKASFDIPILRDEKNNTYKINENLLKIDIDHSQINIAEAIKDIIDAYVLARSQTFNNFIVSCQNIQKQDPLQVVKFIKDLLKPNIDARVFEIVSYAILKEYYAEKQIYWGESPDERKAEYLVLYKTGRTNANDGGIDFVMKPLGRFFQVTETLDVGKYFLDIDKVQRYPITFVVKTEHTVETILNKIREKATEKYNIKAIVQKYMESIEEVINIPELMSHFDRVLERGKGAAVIEEIVLQSRVEFNVEAEEQDILINEDGVENE
ncbi:hypothetical protein [Planktothrix rubescens]|uniref:hypothetical protein n=1 Tax=Planktothrix rubescens TaxID=59512 RepID=UPI0003F60B88|nr:hypothetical protein [Planktothrix rubescens]